MIIFPFSLIIIKFYPVRKVFVSLHCEVGLPTPAFLPCELDRGMCDIELPCLPVLASVCSCYAVLFHVLWMQVKNTTRIVHSINPTRSNTYHQTCFCVWCCSSNLPPLFFTRYTLLACTAAANGKSPYTVCPVTTSPRFLWPGVTIIPRIPCSNNHKVVSLLLSIIITGASLVFPARRLLPSISATPLASFFMIRLIVCLVYGRLVLGLIILCCCAIRVANVPQEGKPPSDRIASLSSSKNCAVSFLMLIIVPLNPLTIKVYRATIDARPQIVNY